MNKCGWCLDSKNVEGKLVCPFYRCQMTQDELNKILEKIGRMVPNG